MKIIIKARHMDLTPALKAYAEEKLGNSLIRIFDRPALKIEIELSDIGKIKNNEDKESQATVYMPKGKTINIVETTDNMYKAIDLCHDRLLIQVKRERDKMRNNSRIRKLAEKQRAETAKANMTAGIEDWQHELKEYETSS